MIKIMSEESQKNKFENIIHSDSNNYLNDSIQQNKIGIKIYKSIISIFEQKGAIKLEVKFIRFHIMRVISEKIWHLFGMIIY